MERVTRHLQNTRTRNHGCQRIVVILETEANTSPFKLMMVFNDMLRMEHQSHKSKVAGLSQERYREQIALFSFVAQSEPILANTFVGCQGLLPDLSSSQCQTHHWTRDRQTTCQHTEES
ncbi:hypothetical protein AcV5_004786 [Taiwanofungus camphoratus]|nr:hypothetical protein AcV5_004786 [Antrodia cinnamomea]KAI0936717.1 hypothetical protein AcV5_004786 [Antrodia cinnamomea]